MGVAYTRDGLYASIYGNPLLLLSDFEVKGQGHGGPDVVKTQSLLNMHFSDEVMRFDGS